MFGRSVEQIELAAPKRERHGDLLPMQAAAIIQADHLTTQIRDVLALKRLPGAVKQSYRDSLSD